MSGWKTKVAAVLIAVAAALEALGEPAAALIFVKLGEALGMVGIGHKIQKLGEKPEKKAAKR